MTLSDLARILRHSDFKDRLRHVYCDRRTIHLGSSFHRGLWTQGDFGTSMPFKSREESIPSSFGAIGEARQAAIAARSTVFRGPHPRWLLRASVDRWRGVHQVLLTRGDCLRMELSSGKCRRDAPSPNRAPHDVALGRRGTARQMRSGRSGMSRCRTPNGRSASTTALTIAGVEPSVAASPMPLAPIGLWGVGVTVASVVNEGRSSAWGTA